MTRPLMLLEKQGREHMDELLEEEEEAHMAVYHSHFGHSR
jgi:hypothetical protein